VKGGVRLGIPGGRLDRHGAEQIEFSGEMPSLS
jgi:hypothetical protein